MDYRHFKDFGAYAKNITELIWNYIAHRDLFPHNAKLAIQPDINEVIIENPDECRNCDFYELHNFISITEQGGLIPNEAAIRLLANRYYPATM